MGRKIFVWILILAVLAGGGFLLYRNSNPNPPVVAGGQATKSADSPVDGLPAPVPGGEDYSDLIQVSTPLPNQKVTSPLTVRGKARGTWYFEASFPVKLFDADGNQLGVTPAQAQSDWMTTDFVPFEVTLNFQKPATATGTLVLLKDNPSGLPENDDSMSIPVSF
ncbi:MAG: Gmad2 immunoglobulin-like domain-containing protein [bacterium]|nr:Gmad2 immunoglobulin-like domain-containing protein [bacterium]